MMKLRAATPADAPAVRRLFTEAFTPIADELGYRPSPMDRDYGPLLSHCFGLALDVDGAVAGFAITRPTPTHLYLEAIAVRPGLQRNGGGAFLLNGVERLSSQLCLPRVRLHTDPALMGARRFYRAAGYRDVGSAGEGCAARMLFEKPVTTMLTRVLAKSPTA